MPQLRPDPTFYASPKHAIEAPPEELAYVALPNADSTQPDAIGVVDLKPGSRSYGQLVHQVEMPYAGDELHHFGWNACSSHLCPWAGHAHVERRYLIAPGILSSRIHVLDTKPDPHRPEIVKVIAADALAKRTGYAAPHTIHCGPDGVYVNGLGTPDGDGPGGVFVLDHESFEPRGQWEEDRGPQHLAYDFAWHLGFDTMITSEWGTPRMVNDGVVPELLLGGKYGHQLHVWDLRKGRHRQTLDLGPRQQMTLVLQPAHNPGKPFGFVCVVVSLDDLSSSVWLWYLDRKGGNGAEGEWKTKKVIEIPAEPADPADLPPLLQGFKAVPPLITDIALSLDDRFLYVSCWGSGELRQYDVTDPFAPKLTAMVQIGGIVRRAAHPADPNTPLNGGPQMVETSRDGKRVYLTNGLYSPWDRQFYPDGIQGWMVKLDARPDGGMEFEHKFLLRIDGSRRTHQVRLQGGDGTSDSFCYAS
ncbi:MAG TPA: selenium-binding protein SBP56-related protein [Gemmatimonadales bacterium]|nr:selenium-binding protein SBP56-related protein [Gemmatimonadales bacterium]